MKKKLVVCVLALLIILQVCVPILSIMARAEDVPFNLSSIVFGDHIISDSVRSVTLDDDNPSGLVTRKVTGQIEYGGKLHNFTINTPRTMEEVTAELEDENSSMHASWLRDFQTALASANLPGNASNTVNTPQSSGSQLTPLPDILTEDNVEEAAKTISGIKSYDPPPNELTRNSGGFGQAYVDAFSQLEGVNQSYTRYLQNKEGTAYSESKNIKMGDRFKSAISNILSDRISRGKAEQLITEHLDIESRADDALSDATTDSMGAIIRAFRDKEIDINLFDRMLNERSLTDRALEDAVGWVKGSDKDYYHSDVTLNNALLLYDVWRKESEGLTGLEEVESDELLEDMDDLIMNFISITDEGVIRPSSSVITGIALSSLYKPLKTNITEFQYTKYVQSDGFSKFHRKYGSLRKNLLMSDNEKAADNWQNTKSISSLRPATLNDMLSNLDGDIVLIADNKYYNKDYVNYESTQTKELAGIEWYEQQLADEDPEEGVEYEVDTELVVDTPQEVAAFNEAFATWKTKDFSFAEANQYLAVEVSRSMGFRQHYTEVSNRDDTKYVGVTPYTGLVISFNIMNSPNLQNKANMDGVMGTPVFVSTGRETKGKSTSVYINNLFLQNIAGNPAIRFSTALDMNSPLFIDVYGNILTESGLVVVPAASNGTLNPEYNWLTLSTLLNYGDKEYIKVIDGQSTINKNPINMNDTKNDLNYYITAENRPDGASKKAVPVLKSTEGSGFGFIKDTYRITSSNIKVALGNSTVTIPIDHFDSGSYLQMQALYQLNNAMYTDSTISPLNTGKWFGSVMIPVTKGARMEDIDYTALKIVTEDTHSEGTLAQAAKYEEMHRVIKTGMQNSLLTMPDIVYMEGIEYVTFFAFRILIIGMTIAFCIQIYIQAAKSRLGPKTFLSILGNFIIVIFAIFSVGAINNVSYYMANRAFLQDEALLVAGLTNEKKNASVELGVTTATKAEVASDLVIEVDKLDINWAEYLRKVVTDFKILSMQELYASEKVATPLLSDQFKLKGASIQLPLETLFETSDIVVEPSNHKITQYVKSNPDASFYLPYYAIIDYLVYSINTYNTVIGEHNYDNYYYGDGKTRSIGISEDYFKSNAFLITAKDMSEMDFEFPSDTEQVKTKELAGYDKLGLNQFYGDTFADGRQIFPRSAYEEFEKSQWFKDEFLPIGEPEASERLTREFRKLVTEMDRKAVKFVLKYEDLLGRVSDETFIKMMALQMSLEYNRLFRTGGPTALEVGNFANEDLMRFATSDTAETLENSAYNFPKFVLEAGGLPSIYAANVLEMIGLISSYVKPFATIFIYLAILMSLFFYKCVLNKRTENLKGFALLTLALCVANLSYAVVIKAAVYLPNIGMPPFICILFQIVIHYVYIYFYSWLSFQVIRNWRDLGAEKLYSTFTQNKFSKNKRMDIDDVRIRNQNDGADGYNPSAYGWEYYEELKSRDRQHPGKSTDDFRL